MKPLVFATHNPHKLNEIRAQLGSEYPLRSLDDIGYREDIEETADTLQGNALIKAQHIYEQYGLDCFSEDTGLEVTAIGGAPGVHTARYAGPQRSAQDNMDKLLGELAPHGDRSARFRTVICLIESGTPRYFEGICEGFIAHSMHGDGGFGYDPIFIPQGDTRTFAQMDSEEKLALSHRARAVSKLIDYLKSKSNT